MWTIGRDREKSHAAQWVKSEAQQKLLFNVIDTIHDVKDGSASPQAFLDAARKALVEGGSRVADETAAWVIRLASEHPEVALLWDELANHPRASVREHVATVLYWYIPERQSDRLFAKLRLDKSKKVRASAIERFEVRPDGQGRLVKRFDASNFSDPAPTVTPFE